MLKIFFDSQLTLVLHFQTSGIGLQTISHDLILGQKLTPDSLIILLKLKIASEGLFGPENHEDDFFEKIGFF